ncbi:magnesium transporter CorA family protein [Patescibacteria group bacterium]|nr:magnesium transporter CorA family protein [Patescibacteria group bacterium]
MTLKNIQSKKLKEVIIDNLRTRAKKLTWINISNAGKKELEYLHTKYNFHSTHLSASRGNVYAQRTTFERTEEYLFIILQFPKLENGNIKIKEIEIFFSHNYLVTIHNNVHEINDFFKEVKKNPKNTLAFKKESPRILLYELIQKLLLNSFDILDEISKNITKVEKIIFAQEQKEAVTEILLIRRNILNIRRILENHTKIIAKIQNLQRDKLIPNIDIKEHYDNLIDYSQNLWEISTNRKEIAELLNNTNESLINYKLNNIMKTLTIFSVIVFPLTLLAAIFGMNVTGGMPLLDSPFGFWQIMFSMIIGCMIMLFYFKRKKWL